MFSFPVTLPEGFSPLVQVGDSVTEGQPIAQKKSNTEQVVNIPQQLKVSLKQVKNVLKKNPGDPIHKGEVVAEKKGFLGMNNAAIISNLEGIVFRYERGTGNLVIRTSFDVPETVISPVAGTIALCDNNKIVVRIESVQEPASNAVGKEGLTGATSNVAEENIQSEGAKETVSIGGNAQGELFVLEGSLYDLTGEAAGKIVLAKGFTREVLMKGVGVGSAGFIGGEISKEDLDFFAEKHPGVTIIQVDEDTLERLRHWNGKKLKVDGGEKEISLVL